MSSDKKKQEKSTDEAVEDLDDGFVADGCCGGCCQGCCGAMCWSAPPPFKVVLLPWIFFTVVFAVIFVLFGFNLLGLCTVTDCINGYYPIAGVALPLWALFFLIILVGLAIARLIVFIIWAILRLILGPKSLAWHFVGGPSIEYAVGLLLFDLVYFFDYNTILISLYGTYPVLYGVLRAVGIIIVVVAVVLILSSLTVTFIVYRMHRSEYESLKKLHRTVRLIDVLRGLKDSGLKAFMSVATELGKKKETKSGDAVVNVNKAGQPMNDQEIHDLFKAMDKDDNGFITSKEFFAYYPGSEADAKALWGKLNNGDPRLYKTEFAVVTRRIFEEAKKIKDDFKNRQFLVVIMNNCVRAFFGIFGAVFILLALGVSVADLMTAIGLFALTISLLFAPVVGKAITSFIFLVDTRAFNIGDHVIYNGDRLVIDEVTLLTTYAHHPDGRDFILQNSVLANATLENWTRSHSAVLILKPTLAAGTPQERIDQFGRAVHRYVKARQDRFLNDFLYITNNVDGPTNSIQLEIRVFLRGVPWDSVVYLNERTELFRYVRKVAGEINIGYNGGAVGIRMLEGATFAHDGPSSYVEPADDDDDEGKGKTKAKVDDKKADDKKVDDKPSPAPEKKKSKKKKKEESSSS